ncbi:NADH-quinone oxidoreductase subunit J family protein [Mucilaginibacter auburnensis]|uniref:NADH-quinone oxidoreductase subunit J n=1 Tax=Mucilaginibacter auburnensis TaxID=1457233 RepID=A0A2H9VUI3_9SPHI|nr:NADH-quinone oxidoreductase subunit J [Mucilaginibacter auburnensis]PJJ84475.1 NADH-quinone oxidoreductase subunit J [Mucilaginibacter auburnensis]
MSLAQILFYAMAFIAIASALYVASSKNLVRGIFMFFVTLFALAGLYVLALADFVAVSQIVIYVGGILVLILFAFMLSGKETLDSLGRQKDKFVNSGKIPGLVLSLLFFAVMVTVLLKLNADDLGWIKQSVASGNVIKPTDNGIHNIGINLMTTYLLPFEAISILLMMALVGAAHIARKEQDA